MRGGRGAEYSVAAGDPRGCHPGGHNGFHSTDAMVGQVDVGDSGSDPRVAGRDDRSLVSDT